jgi:hypothetical protein
MGIIDETGNFKVLQNKIIQVSWIIALMAISITGYAQDNDGFYVIPVPTGEVIEKEVCNGAPIGDVVFTIEIERDYVVTGDVYSTTTGHLIEITGGRAFGLDYSANFRAAPSTLPPPSDGVKGPYYILGRGEVAYARFL